ncbi:MAG: hypothetical protein AAFR39_06995, partial [Pseudomonadota bacterium]
FSKHLVASRKWQLFLIFVPDGHSQNSNRFSCIELASLVLREVHHAMLEKEMSVQTDIHGFFALTD